MNLDEREVRVTFKLSIATRPVEFIVDTGAMLTLLSVNVLDPRTKIFTNRSVGLSGISGIKNEIRTLGVSFGRFEIGEHELDCKLHIVNDSVKFNADGLLGWDFLGFYYGILNPWRESLTFLLPPYHRAYDPKNKFKSTEKSPKFDEGNISNDTKLETNWNVKTDASQRPPANHTLPQVAGETPSAPEILPRQNKPENGIAKRIKEKNKEKINYDEIEVISSEELPDDYFEEEITTVENYETKRIVVENQDLIDFRNFGKFENTKEDTIYVYKIGQEEPDTRIRNFIDRKEDRIDFILNGLDLSHCVDNEKNLIENICSDFDDVFYIEGDRLTHTDVVQHRIYLKPDTAPIFTRQYRLPELQRSEVYRQLKEMEENGIIEPSNSPWNSPIILVKKKSENGENQKYRLVVDFRKLNEVTQAQKFPIPLIDDILDDLEGCKYFSTLDLHGAFHQILMHPDDRDYTSFSAGNFKYRWVRMPMGLTSSPLTWQYAINTIFKERLGKNLHIYLDDLLIATKTLREHIEILNEVLQLLRKHCLKLKIEKCKFFRHTVNYLGHIVSEDGCKADPKTIECIEKYPFPKSLVEVQRFTGMCNYRPRAQRHLVTS